MIAVRTLSHRCEAIKIGSKRCGTFLSLHHDDEVWQDNSVPSAGELRQQFIERRAAFSAELKRHRTLANLTQPALAAKIDGLSINAYKKYEWAKGESIPDADRVDEIASVLGEDARVLVDLRSEADKARIALRNLESPLRTTERVQPWDGYTARELFARSIDSVVSNCIAMERSVGKVVGWRHFFENEQLPVTPMSSAYGLRILLWANHAGSVPSIGQIRDSILSMENTDGGWSARTQNHLARVEAYGPTLLSLRLAGLTDDDLEKRVSHFEQILDPDLDPATYEHTTILTIACSTLSSVHPESYRIPQLLSALKDSARQDESGVFWTQSLRPGLRETLSGSVPHTARAVVAIAQAPSEMTAGLSDLAIGGVRWLESQSEYMNDRELIERSNESDPEFLNMRHFSSAWVARALALASKWTRPDLDALRLAEDAVLASVGHDGLWRWQSGEIPIWMTYHGLRALEDISRTHHDLTRS